MYGDLGVVLVQTGLIDGQGAAIEWLGLYIQALGSTQHGNAIQ